ncbi:MAG TPA: CaiB/BaiF CoA-transferase family protein [Candidatus Binataceae bacterium]|jgi:CoA:oxalate CoA-transferase|nr:CaiB/BaiF CoA-transferase family protein [Candidatus Binataceae bacterium]
MEQQALMLKGYHVLDFTHFVAGPTCTRIMAEMGADVIKVERSLEGDHVRQLGIMKDGMSTYYFQHSHSKRSLGIDLRNPRAKELILAMIPKIDVVVENFAPGVIASMGFGYETLRKINPKIVMCSISATGQTGPLSNRPGYDFIGAAFAGVTDLLGEADRPPIVPTMAIGDVSTGVAAAMAVGYALLSAARNGVGQYLDASLLDTYFHMHELAVPVLSQRRETWKPRRNGSQHPAGSPTGVFQATGGYIMLLVQQHEFVRLARAMGHPELATDPRFSSNGRRVRNNAALKEMIESWLATFPDRDSAIAALDRERVPCGPVLTLEEAMDHPHLRERKTVRQASDPRLGDFDLPAMPVKFSAWPERTNLKASLVGQDNEAVLSEMLGLSGAEIEELYAAKILLKAPGEAAAAAAS